MLAPELIQPAVSVARELQPYPHEGAIALAPLALLLIAVSVLYAVQRRRARRRGAGRLASLALGVALGNALIELDTMLRADGPAVVIMADVGPHSTAVGDGRAPEPDHLPPRRAAPPAA